MIDHRSSTILFFRDLFSQLCKLGVQLGWSIMSIMYLLIIDFTYITATYLWKNSIFIDDQVLHSHREKLEAYRALG